MLNSINKTLLNEYQERSFLQMSFSLNKQTHYRDLIGDSKLFRDALEENIKSGYKQIPYINTETIIKVAHDPNINEVISCLLNGDRWVMWGANIREGTPNEAHLWHVDLESWLWPTITVVIGIEGCSTNSATYCIPGSHKFSKAPDYSVNSNIKSGESVITHQYDSKAEQFIDFGDGQFYVFNAKSWHRGSLEKSINRRVLFLHYQRASDPRIPFMVDYDKHLWSKQPAPYIIGNGKGRAREDVYTLPLKYRLGRIIKSFRALKYE